MFTDFQVLVRINALNALIRCALSSLQPAGSTVNSVVCKVQKPGVQRDSPKPRKAMHRNPNKKKLLITILLDAKGHV